MLSKDKKYKITEDILKSDILQKSPKSSALLKYLVKATLAGDYIKEDIIDLEFFGDNNRSDKNNSRVRVNVYNLRKKLDQYYKTEGRQSTWKLCIDKGQYNVRFELQNVNKTYFQKIKTKHGIPYLLLLFISIIFIAKSIKSSPPLWSSFFKNKKSTILIIGDAFGLKGKTITGYEGWTRDYHINSTEEYYEFVEKNQSLKTTNKPSNYKYITGMGAIATQSISKLFYPLDHDFEIQFSSNTSMNDLKKGNLIYVGQYTVSPKVTTLFNEFNPYFKIVEQKLILNRHPNIKDQTFNTYFKGENKDFSIISKFKGPENNECFLFFSNHEIGVKATIENFTNKKFLKEFHKRHLLDKENFTAIYQAHGKDRTNMGLKEILVIPF
ncbi:hypothetical protein [Wenyingzhuangia sp. 2_MG-2023]|uniref:hypothetical protein n=1 Tax=Wenyingzhuangia sp. 2_MG-2023 TaxID=3062639 RepID=UPI0026E3CA05|nr:hypothetical protein [Wenyingzhuangia sp. 2_MG-2023]MDO6738728.1 hypothetical protein [Wenyingzhuangia sp. 2_MG-2023]MDO6803009.1 hypothetical protein [Wenyingzhuangia sp. 1_MG-2023]